jgi:hypothetical protein
MMLTKRGAEILEKVAASGHIEVKGPRVDIDPWFVKDDYKLLALQTMFSILRYERNSEEDTNLNASLLAAKSVVVTFVEDQLQLKFSLKENSFGHDNYVLEGERLVEVGNCKACHKQFFLDDLISLFNRVDMTICKTCGEAAINTISDKTAIKVKIPVPRRQSKPRGQKQ